MGPREIICEGKILARFIPNTAWKEGLSFFSQDEEFVQVGAWVYDEGKALAPHVHNFVERKVTHTQEVLYIRSGSIQADIYDLKDQLCESLIVGAGEILILLEGGHGYKILENATQVLEIKNGPYAGPEIDRRRI